MNGTNWTTAQIAATCNQLFAMAPLARAAQKSVDVDTKANPDSLFLPLQRKIVSEYNAIAGRLGKIRSVNLAIDRGGPLPDTSPVANIVHAIMNKSRTERIVSVYATTAEAKQGITAREQKAKQKASTSTAKPAPARKPRKPRGQPAAASAPATAAATAA